jgi:anti-sigma-K factor RskA
MNTDLRNDDAFVDRLTAYLDRQADHADDRADLDVAEFAMLASELRAPATWGGPPPGLRDAILSRVSDQAAAAAPLTAAPKPRVRWYSRWGRLTWAIPVAAVAAAAFTVGVIAVDRALQPGQPPGVTYVAAGTQLAPGATATVVVSANPSGFSLRVQATGLPAAAEGSYYSAWLHGPRGVVPLGSFHQRQQGSSVALWSGVDPKDYTTLVITLQAEGEPPRPSDLIVMTATLKH